MRSGCGEPFAHLFFGVAFEKNFHRSPCGMGQPHGHALLPSVAAWLACSYHQFHEKIYMPVLNFTPAFMASGLVCPPDKKRIEYCDADAPGSLIECRSAPNAVPTWYLRFKADGKTAYTRLGNVQELGLARPANKRSRSRLSTPWHPSRRSKPRHPWAP